MANTNPSRIGQSHTVSNGTVGDADALFLKVFSNEILTTFDETNVMKELHTTRTITSGKSAQFPVSGIAEAKYYQPGQDILDASNSYLSNIKHNEKVIFIDDMLISSTFIAEFDELKAHYSMRATYSKEIGKALAKRYDLAVMKTWVAAARSSANINGGDGGTVIDGAGSGNTLDTAPELIDVLFEMAQKLDEKNVPDDGQRFAVLPPELYYKLITADNSAVSLALNRDAGGVGSVATGQIPQVAGIKLVKSQHIKDVRTDLSSTTTGDGSSAVKNDPFGGNGAGYNGDLSATAIIGGHPAAVGTVSLLDLTTQSEYSIAHQGTLFLAKYGLGHGVLRPECAVEITV
tara:strand:+ start:3080 stop:4120 length:1041 start_codon:yes stop_codon:yes gene_type:complete